MNHELYALVIPLANMLYLLNFKTYTVLISHSVFVEHNGEHHKLTLFFLPNEDYALLFYINFRERTVLPETRTLPLFFTDISGAIHTKLLDKELIYKQSSDVTLWVVFRFFFWYA